MKNGVGCLLKSLFCCGCWWVNRTPFFARRYGNDDGMFCVPAWTTKEWNSPSTSPRTSRRKSGPGNNRPTLSNGRAPQLTVPFCGLKTPNWRLWLSSALTVSSGIAAIYPSLRKCRRWSAFTPFWWYVNFVYNQFIWTRFFDQKHFSKYKDQFNGAFPWFFSFHFLGRWLVKLVG